MMLKSDKSPDQTGSAGHCLLLPPPMDEQYTSAETQDWCVLCVHKILTAACMELVSSLKLCLHIKVYFCEAHTGSDV